MIYVCPNIIVTRIHTFVWPFATGATKWDSLAQSLTIPINSVTGVLGLAPLLHQLYNIHILMEIRIT